MKKLNRLSSQVTDENGDVDNLPDEFFKKAHRGKPWPDSRERKEEVTLGADADVAGHGRAPAKELSKED